MRWWWTGGGPKSANWLSWIKVIVTSSEKRNKEEVAERSGATSHNHHAGQRRRFVRRQRVGYKSDGCPAPVDNLDRSADYVSYHCRRATACRRRAATGNEQKCDWCFHRRLQLYSDLPRRVDSRPPLHSVDAAMGDGWSAPASRRPTGYPHGRARHSEGHRAWSTSAAARRLRSPVANDVAVCQVTARSKVFLLSDARRLGVAVQLSCLSGAGRECGECLKMAFYVVLLLCEHEQCASCPNILCQDSIILIAHVAGVMFWMQLDDFDIYMLTFYQGCLFFCHHPCLLLCVCVARVPVCVWRAHACEWACTRACTCMYVCVTTFRKCMFLGS